MSTIHRTIPPAWRVGVAALAALLLAATFAVPASAHGNKQRADIQGQGGEGDVVQRHGALLLRNDYSLRVRWRMPTPEPGSYAYPTPDQIPPGAPPHPPIEPGAPEVFTLWAFVFNHPDECSDQCDFDDIGDTPAQGGIYQLDGTIPAGPLVRMHGKVRIGQQPATGAMLVAPRDAEVHVAMAPHGMAREGAELRRQLNGAVGGPPVWWPAIFLP